MLSGCFFFLLPVLLPSHTKCWHNKRKHQISLRIRQFNGALSEIPLHHVCVCVCVRACLCVHLQAMRVELLRLDAHRTSNTIKQRVEWG